MSKETMIPRMRFNNFMDDWLITTLNEIAEITMGQSPKSEYYTDNPSDYILVQGNADIKNGSVVPRIYTSKSTKIAGVGDIILTVRAPVGEVATTNYKVVLGRGVASLKGNNFLYQKLLMMNKIKYWEKYSTGSTFQSINSNDIRNAKILVPLLKEQQKIGNLFEKIDQAISLQQQFLDATKEYKKSMLQKMFPKKGEEEPEIRFKEFDDNWKETKLNCIAENKNRQRIPVTAKNRIPGDTPYYGSNGVQDYVEGYTHEGSYILLAEDGANDIDNYPVRFVSGKMWVNNHAHVLKAKGNIDSYFLSYVLKTINMRQYLVGSSRMKLNASTMMKMKMLVPILQEQQKIGSFFKTLDEKIEQEEQKLETYQSMKKALMQRMFV